MNFIRPTGGAKFDYSKIQEITNSMKEKLKQKYETLTSVQNETQTGQQENMTQSSVLDNYITNIETLFLDGVFDGDLRVNGTIYAKKIELEDATTTSSEKKESTPVLSFSSTQQWIDKHLKKVKIEDSDLWRCRMYNADFVNETLFRDNVRMERNLDVMGNTIITGTLFVRDISSSLQSSQWTTSGSSIFYRTGNVGIGTSTPSSTLEISGNVVIDTNVLVVDGSNNRVGIGLTNPSVALDISGNVNTNGKLRESGNNLIPRGIIVAWFGNSASVPAGWALCNGQNGTPDLRGRFILGINPSGANNSSFTSRDVSGTGGVETVTLTTAQMPSHTHDAYLPRGDVNWTPGGGNTIWGWGTGYGFTTQATGGNQAHENMPPFFALAYIMKL